MTSLEQRLIRLEDAYPPNDAEPDLVRVYRWGNGREQRLYMRRGIVIRTEGDEPDDAA